MLTGGRGGMYKIKLRVVMTLGVWECSFICVVLARHMSCEAYVSMARGRNDIYCFVHVRRSPQPKNADARA